jgi:hypothetical protein
MGDLQQRRAGAAPVLGAAGAAFPAFIEEPMSHSVSANAASASGSVVTNDMCFPKRIRVDGNGRGGRGSARTQCLGADTASKPKAT